MQLSERQVKKVNDIIDKTVAEFIRNIPQQVRKVLEGAIVSALGLSDRWGGKYEVDHANGRESLIGQWVRVKATEEAEKAIGGIIVTALAALGKDQKMVLAIMTEAQTVYKDRLKKAVLDLAADRASKDAQEILDKLRPTFEPVLGSVGELANPESGGQSATAEAILERLAQEFVSSESEVQVSSEEIASGQAGQVGSPKDPSA